MRRMVNSVAQSDSITTRELRKALLCTRKYRDLQARVRRRLGIDKAAVSRAASARHIGRYRRIEIALLEELVRFEPELTELVEKLKKNHVA
ncbi:hypothetical protein LCGC14_1797960 [marine sediment metagenome]|uniref:Uncharacterized protein n=1 Tax=marine sediment metagenome TaxID=412755 RepID=A0A0F9J593_9ZZZZ